MKTAEYCYEPGASKEGREKILAGKERRLAELNAVRQKWKRGDRVVVKPPHSTGKPAIGKVVSTRLWLDGIRTYKIKIGQTVVTLTYDRIVKRAK